MILLRKLLTFILCGVLSLSIVSDITAASDLSVPESFTFNPKVSSSYLDEIFGETMIQTWYNLVDAVLEGADTFDCPDQETYDWVMGQFPDRCFPVLTELIEPVYGGAVHNGTARFAYKTSKEETKEKLSEFKTLVEDILNASMQTDYSDLEKALSLYRYFYSNYEYDYDTFERQNNGDDPYTSSYRFLTEGSGVCKEISTAYSYLLLQAGVDATIMMGQSGSGDHQWSYVRINGENYHIDPTYVLDAYSSLEYFMMTDEKRSETFPPESFVIASNYTQEHEHPVYMADADTFSILWDTNLEDFDHNTRIISCYAGDGSPVEFNYEGY